ncbi:hypothetical protein [Bacillus licheniformis]|uniref:hypothetical protein n=1 Tax=Bacillus licheniformis TaxID=1402 RepID=UPI000925DDA3|nr:hypothetical protein [Bacillus licheniformis]OJT57568.1 hypothetical protein BFP47_12830 [Bacillus licheniformis]OJT69789.1 hypothetical protein BFP46_04055 [Bacillus licheniformis]
MRLPIKQCLTNEESDHAVLQFVTNTLPKLKFILRREERRIEKGSVHALDWLIENGGDPAEFDFDNWVDAFNEYLNCLYDIGDTVTLSRDSRVNDEKFLWIS